MNKIHLIIKIICLLFLMVSNLMSQEYRDDADTKIDIVSYQVQLPNKKRINLNRQIRIPNLDSQLKSSIVVQKKRISENHLVYSLRSLQNENLTIYKLEPEKNKYSLIWSCITNNNSSNFILQKESNEKYTIVIFKSNLGYLKIDNILW